jgi:cell division protein FtsA
MKTRKTHPYLKSGVFALDLGTSKFVLAGLVGGNAKEAPRLETVAIPAAGFKKGQLVSLQDALSALQELITLAENHFGFPVERVAVGVAGAHLKSAITHVSFSARGESISSQTLRHLESEARKQTAGEGREVLHLIPCGFHLDGHRHVDNPVGLNCATIESDYLVIDADLAYLRDMIGLINQAGLEVTRFVVTPYVSALVNTPNESRQLGCAVLDMGAGTTDGIVFVAGQPRFLFSISIGGLLMAQDLGIGLNLPFAEAERLKNHCGLSVSDSIASLEVRDLRGSSRHIGVQDTYPVLAPRVHELLAFLSKKLGPFQGALGAGMILTGGACELPGLLPFLERHGRTIARHGTLDLLYGRYIARALDCDLSSHLHDDPHLSGVLGIIHHELSRRAELHASRQEAWHQRYFHQFANWLKELS